MGAIFSILADVSVEIVINSDGRSRIIGTTLLQDDRSRCSGRQLEAESVGIGTQFLQQTLLHFFQNINFSLIKSF